MMHPLHLVIKPENWRLFNLRNSDPKFKRFAEKVKKRDRHTCQYCGLQAEAYLDVVNLDYNYFNNTFSNLVTACAFCVQCHFIDRVGASGYGGGTLIYLPELSQNDVSGLCHVLFRTIYRDDPGAEAAQSMYRALRLRSQLIDQTFGEGNSNPENFTRYFIEAGLLAKSKLANSILENIRLLPSRTKFKEQIAAWSQAMSFVNESEGNVKHES